ncbi:hyaluronidase-3-like isoform X4 [Rissa tridactyla]|uniref:hyaluronidase-3-like isoform X4 n=1 Tax=Rissa tridactyla TaxID=75485 RepID=UPI0023BAF412|nr:hyaluronidase-3-like isoform X4 [Rissa tridactyla]
MPWLGPWAVGHSRHRCPLAAVRQEVSETPKFAEFRGILGWAACACGQPTPMADPRAPQAGAAALAWLGCLLHPTTSCPTALLSPQGASPTGSRQHRMVLALVLWACLVLATAGGESPAPEPLAGGQPFAVVWNIPTGRCQRGFGVGLPLGDYGIMENQDSHFAGQNITIFYKNKFGLYPYLSRQGVPRNGGIPQRIPLDAHLARVARDIDHLLRPTFHGLAVVDWEEWRPLWAQNWGAKRIYRVASEQWVRDRHGLLPVQRRLKLARQEFEQAAQALMEETLLLGRTLRPGGLWGFYRFPDCFNTNWAKEANYTGQCRLVEVRRNNQLGWLWAASSALYPSIYLPPALPPALRRRYVHHRLREALRVANFGANGLLPVVAYSRLSFRRSPQFLELADLVHTIGESAALGAAGLVLWGDMSYSRSARRSWHTRIPVPSSRGPHTALLPTHAAQAQGAMPREAGEDSMGKAEGAAPAEPGDPDSSEPGTISLRPVESISDLHWASGGHKGVEGNGPAPSRSLHRLPPRPTSPRPLPLLPTLRPMPAAGPCPCLGPGHPLLLALLGLLALASLVLATLAVYLSVLQSQSVRALAQWLESQEDAVRQLRVASRQLWARLNASAEPGGHR